MLQYAQCMIVISHLLWDSWNISYIARHGVIPDEVEYVCHHNPLVIRGKIRKRVVLIGETMEQRLLGVVLENHGEGKYYPLTAYDALPEDRVLYTRERGGENDETEK
jgi:hypothetical protein